MSTDGPPLIRPIPRRPFDLNFTSATPPDDSSPPSPAPEASSSNHLDPRLNGVNDAETSSFSRTQSILNLTSSTLFGIYSPTVYGTEREEPSTPWGTGAESPKDRMSIDSGDLGKAFTSRTDRPLHRRRSSQHVIHVPMPNYLFNLAIRTVLLFGFGMGYGLLVTHLHDDRRLAPFNVEGIMKPRYDWLYLVFWGVAGVGLGSLLPWIDMLWEDTTHTNPKITYSSRELAGTPEEDEAVISEAGLFADWNPVVRSFGAFVGIAFAIRKLPWTSTLQVSLTLALVNPVLWYLIDRSKPGFLLSIIVGILGTTVLLSLNPEMVPSPATSPSFSFRNQSSAAKFDASEVLGGLVAKETIECGTWIISVLFCSCVCFGNIGRKLSLGGRREMGIRKDSFR